MGCKSGRFISGSFSKGRCAALLEAEKRRAAARRFSLSKKSVIASQFADWRGNLYSWQCGGHQDRCYGGIAAEIGTKNMPPACFLNAPTDSHVASLLGMTGMGFSTSSSGGLLPAAFLYAPLPAALMPRPFPGSRPGSGRRFFRSRPSAAGESQTSSPGAGGGRTPAGCACRTDRRRSPAGTSR